MASTAPSTPESPSDCERPSCASIKSMFAKSMGAGGLGDGGAARSAPAPASASVVAGPADCPVGREELGRGTWALLHTAAAWFPDQPTDQDKAHAHNLISSLAALYPCTHCAEDFRATVRDSPPRCPEKASRLAPRASRLAPRAPTPHRLPDHRRTLSLSSRAAFSIWMCKQHNMVNEKLEKVRRSAWRDHAHARRVAAAIFRSACPLTQPPPRPPAPVRLFAGQARREMEGRPGRVLRKRRWRRCTRVPGAGINTRRDGRARGRRSSTGLLAIPSVPGCPCSLAVLTCASATSLPGTSQGNSQSPELRARAVVCSRRRRRSPVRPLSPRPPPWPPPPPPAGPASSRSLTAARSRRLRSLPRRLL